MTSYINEINYDALMENALKQVVKSVLTIAQIQGLPGDHHFYVAFKTSHPETKVSDLIKSQYPEEMTIIIQHQYKNLQVMENHFSVELQFGGISQVLEIPYDAIVYFADPSVRFGLSFNDDNADDDDALLHETSQILEQSKKPADVISIDSFRRGKK